MYSDGFEFTKVAYSDYIKSFFCIKKFTTSTKQPTRGPTHQIPDGGTSTSEANSCPGGHHSNECFSARLMFHENRMHEMYTYLLPPCSANQAICTVKPYSTCNPTYGASVGRGPFAFKPGVRMTVTEHVHLNYVGQQCLVMDRGCRCPPILP